MVDLCGSTVFVRYTNLSTLRRYAARRGFQTLNAYCDVVEANPEAERAAFLDHGLVHTTGFCRDPQFWQNATQHCFSKAKPGFRVLCLGCSVGAELVTVAVHLRNQLEPGEFSIRAIDVAPGCVEKARELKVDRRMLTKIGWQSTALVKVTDRFFQIVPEVAQHVQVDLGNILDFAGPWWSTETGYDLVLARNILLYLREDDLPAVFQAVARALKPSGIFGIGAVDPVPNPDLFQQITPMLYRPARAR